MRRSGRRTRNPTLSASTCDGSSNFNSADVSTASMEQLRLLSVRTLRTQLKRCSLPTSGNKVTMAARLHNYFHTSQGTPILNPNNAVIPPQDPSGQQQATETSPPAGNNLLSQQLANQLPPGNNLFSQQFVSQLSNLLHQYMVQTPPQQSQSVQSNHRDQLTDSNSQPIETSNQVPSTRNQVPSTSNQLPSTSNQVPSISNQLFGVNGEEELSEPSIIQPIEPNPVLHHTSNAPPVLINQSSVMNTIPTSMTTSTDQLLPPVPPRIRERIIKGEYIDFATLLPSIMFSSSLELDSTTSFTVQLPHNNGNLSVHPTAKTRKITSFSSWMEAWNVYLAVCIDHMPSRAPSLVAYQRIITSANTLHPLESWLHYDVQFRTLAASNPTLRWDTRHPDLWLQCITPASAQRTKRWPCPHCGAVTHFPDRCPFRPYSSKQTPNRQWNPSRGQSDSQYTGNPIINKNPMPPNKNLGYCKDFNYTSCNRQYCKFSHSCQTCGSNHPARVCPQVATTRASN